ncbi:MAG TPA: DUF456 domain-containing protein [Arenimonas sp.]|nr:DUF456 domain-containing protein [Arenimonas sp.]
MTLDIILYIVAGLMILIGLLGTFLPVLPGIPLMFFGMLLAAWTGDFALIGTGTLVALGVLTAIAIGIDLLATILGARKFGATRTAMFGAGVGGLIGLFFGLPGLIAGPYLGAMSGEMARGRDFRQAAKVGAGTWIGIVVGAVFKIMLALAMLAVFALALLAL